MEKKPIKRNENLIPISREHHGTLLFCWKLKRGVANHSELDRIIKYVNWYWKEHLMPHFNTEETLLFLSVNDKMVSKALDEHTTIRELIKMLNKDIDENKKINLISELSQIVNNHTRYEERQLFPYLEEKLSAGQLQKIGKELANGEHSAREDYEDEFWKEKPSLF